MDKKNRGYVSPEMDVILLERGNDVCTLSRACVSKPDGTSLGDSPFGCWEDVCGIADWGGD